MFSRRAGVLGWLGIPFVLLFELFGPLIEFLGYIIMAFLWVLGLVSLKIFLIFLFAAVGLGVLLSINAILLEELSYHLYPKVSQRLKLLAWAILENFGYRQLTTVWRSIGLLRWMLKRRHLHWGTIQRDGSWQNSEATAPTHAAPSAVPGNTTP